MPGYDNPQTPGTPASGHYGSYDQPGSQQALNDQDGQYYHFSDKEAGAGAGGAGAGAAKGNWFSRHKLLTGIIAAVVLLAIALGAGLGAGLGSKSNSDSSSSSSANDSGSSSGSSSGSGKNSGSGSSSGGSSSSDKTITPLPKWNLTDTDTKMYGASLGSWLLLERWMNEDWMVNTAGADAWDEWTFIENLGRDKALAALKDHWDTWVTEADLDLMQSAGFNTIRIPVGYWAFVPAAEGEPYLAQSGQTEQLQKMFGWLHDRKMYASIDMHGMPGSQNGDQSSGHNTSSSSQKIGWFSDTNQQISMQAINAAISFIQGSNYSSVVNSIGIVNEPRPWDGSFSQSQKNSNAQITRDFYENAYQACKKAGIPAIFHHGFYSGSGTPAQYWADFATGKDPNYLAYEDHPYPGWFTPQNTSRSYMQNNVCQIVQGGVGYPVPMIITEWSSINGVYDDDWTRTYTNLQAAGYAWSGGSVFWSFKTTHSKTQVLALPDNLQDMYSAVTLINSGVIPKPSANQTNKQFLEAQSGADTCGQWPVESWTNPSTQGAGYSGRRRSLEESVSSDEMLMGKRRLD
ncbi:glycoside hydrolase [Jaminaea rosea]|uniref:glucan 1,3-beta-glucosidase n=1 Tax=Jaminaea rosea TaxID=1569628 RepID=A0A316V1Q4_9BASI|nr:glycoside hydrolase [Jaminaea rosea]PWN30481.1 glycoside hydrolase [Jaminaea rosea]